MNKKTRYSLSALSAILLLSGCNNNKIAPPTQEEYGQMYQQDTTLQEPKTQPTIYVGEDENEWAHDNDELQALADRIERGQNTDRIEREQNVHRQRVALVESNTEEIYDSEEEDTEERPIAHGRKLKRLPFPIMEYNRLNQTGKSILKGAALVEIDGKKIPGKNTQLYLNPITSYSTQWFNQVYVNGGEIEKADSRLYNYLRYTSIKKGGKFGFYDIPAGEYYITGRTEHDGKELRIFSKITIGKDVTVSENVFGVDGLEPSTKL